MQAHWLAAGPPVYVAVAGYLGLIDGYDKAPRRGRKAPPVRGNLPPRPDPPTPPPPPVGAPRSAPAGGVGDESARDMILRLKADFLGAGGRSK